MLWNTYPFKYEEIRNVHFDSDGHKGFIGIGGDPSPTFLP